MTVLFQDHFWYFWYFRGGALSLNSSEMAWTFPMPFYRMNTDRLRMVYVYFHRPICYRNLSITVLFQGSFWYFWYCREGALSPNSSETAWTFPMPFFRMNTDSVRMVYVYFHRPIYHRDFSMTVIKRSFMDKILTL